MVDHLRLIRKILPNSNGCKLIENGYRFVNLRKYLCFAHSKMVTCDFCKKDTNVGSSNLKSPSCGSDFYLNYSIFSSYQSKSAFKKDEPKSYFHTAQRSCKLLIYFRNLQRNYFLHPPLFYLNFITLR